MMKSAVLLTVFLFTQTISGQSVLIESTQPIVLSGVSNELVYHLEGITSQEVFVVSSNGTVKVVENKLAVNPESSGSLRVEFRSLDDSSLIAQKRFRVMDLGPPTPSIYKRSSGEMSKKLLMNAKVESGYVDWEIYGCLPPGPVQSFKLLVTRQGQAVGFVDNNQSLYTREALDLIDSLMPGDELYFIEIVAQNAAGEYGQLTNMKFVVK